ncbi:hypothetical protein JCM10213_004226 [Rhodosporidiobolus nylandii]
MQSPSRPLDSLAEEDDAFTALPSTSSPSSASSTRAQQAHARKHSRIHERNLSAFFPRPGQQGEGYGGTFDDPHAAPFKAGVAEIPSPAATRTAGSAAGAQVAYDTPPRTAAGRRGHHHRHSVSHNLFPFLDAPDTPNRPSSSPTKPLPAKAVDSQLPAASASFRQRYGHLNTFLQLLAFAAFHVPPTTRGLLLLSLVQIGVGAALWVQGQSGESLAVTGLGYLVVFDGIGGLSSGILERRAGDAQAVWDVIGSSKDSSVRQPFGHSRLITLSHFSQAVYLLFSAVYVCKESIEHVLLLHDPQDVDGTHGAGHGGVGHGEGRGVAVEAHDGIIALPRLALLSASLLAAFLAFTLRNHQGLAASLRPASASSRSLRASPAAAASSAVQHLVNPFTATVILFSTALLGISAVLPPTQLAPVDKVLALLESLAMFYIASPAAASTGQILLQTAPHPQAPQMRAINSAISEIEVLPLVIAVESQHTWQLASHSAASSPGAGAAGAGGGAQQAVVTLSIAVKHDTSDADLLEITRAAQARVGKAVGGVAGEGAVDLTVAVKRV